MNNLTKEREMNDESLKFYKISKLLLAFIWLTGVSAVLASRWYAPLGAVGVIYWIVAVVFSIIVSETTTSKNCRKVRLQKKITKLHSHIEEIDESLKTSPKKPKTNIIPTPYPFPVDDGSKERWGE